MSRVKVPYRSGSKAQYNKFISLHPSINITYLEYQNIIYGFNCGFRDHLLETGFMTRFPWGFGDFAVNKRKPLVRKTLKDGKEVINLPVDWKKSRIAGKKIYHLNNHTDGYKFTFRWFMTTSRLKFAAIWAFKPTRATSRLLKHYVDQGYSHKYLNWR